MSKNQPLISVIVPVYNPGKHLYKCLDTITGQTYKNLEIILVDDGSSDGSEKVCDEYAARDNRIVVHHQKNGGVSRARNKGIELSHGDYYSFLDSDDFFELDMFEYLIGLIDTHNCDAVNFEHFLTYYSYEEAHHFEDYSRYGLFDRAGAQKQCVTGVAFACNKLFSKKLITEEVRFKEDIFRGEDGIFVTEAFENADRIWFDKRPLLHYVQSEESAVRGQFRTSQLSVVKMCEFNESFYSEHYPELINIVRVGSIDCLIMIYYDMWADNTSFQKEQLEFHALSKKYYSEIDRKQLSFKKKIKIELFNYNPTIFCVAHKLIHRL